MGRRMTEDDVFYIIGWALLVTVGLIALVWYLFRLPLPSDCVFHAATGLYCPGCGGTRAVLSMLGGHFLKSLYYHPAVIPGALLYVVFMVLNTIRLATRGKFRGMRMRPIYAIIILGLCVANVIMKNVFGLV